MKTRLLATTVVAISILFSSIAKAELVIDRDSFSNAMFSGWKPLDKKRFNTHRGKSVRFESVKLWSYNDSKWMNGGMLLLINDDSMGKHTRINCWLSADDGDKYMEDAKRHNVGMTGVLQSYSDSSGFTVKPCKIKIKN